MSKENQVKIKQNLLKVKSEKGSVTVFVVTTMLFLLMTLIISYMGISNKNNAQLADIKKIKAEYEKQVGDIDKIYEETKAKTLVDIKIECEKEYNIAKGITVTIPAKITLTAEDMSIVAKREYAWSISGTTKPTSWIEFTRESVSTERENAGKGEYYLWVRITTNSGTKIEKVSNAIIVNEGEITLTPDITEPTKGPVNVTIDYENVFKQDKKVGIGKTPEEAKANATLNENTNLKITENCFIYATAKDVYGNPGEASLQIDNIDKENQK